MSKASIADSRRSTAAQFFMDEEEPVEQKSTYDRVVELINQSIMGNNQKLSNLRKVQELIVRKEPNLLDNFLDEMLGFQHDKEADVRKFVVGFIEEACKKDPEILPKVVANLNMMLGDQSVAVQKRVIQASIQLYKVAFKWLCKSKITVDVMESIWAYLEQLKLGIISLLESDNDGVRTQAVKFMEMLVVVQTYPDQDSPKKGTSDVALDDIPGGMKVLRPRKLEEEAKQIFESLVIFHGTPHISSVNLMACMQSLVLIAKQRSEFMAKVIQALESLHANLPPTLAKSQVSSVRKHLKLQLLLLLKHPAAADFQSQIATLLADLGATQQEIMKNLPRPEELKKRALLPEDALPASKRVKVEKVVVDQEEEDTAPPPAPPTSRSLTNTAIDITANDILTKLTPLNVTDLALISMLSLPSTMPAHFQASYTPISVAGTESQVKHLARLIATQLTAVGLGKGVEEMASSPPTGAYEEEEEEEEPSRSIGTVLGGTTVARETKKEKTPLTLLPTGITSKPRRMHLNLQEVTKPLEMTDFIAMVAGAVDRIMESDKKVNIGASVNQIRTKVLIGLAVQFRGHISEVLRNYIFEDLRNRVDLAISWLFEEYVHYQGFSKLSASAAKTSMEHYDECFILLLEDLLQKADQKERDTLLTKFYLEAPCITDNAISLLKTYCEKEATLEHGLNTIKVVIEKRPPKQKTFLHIVFDLSLHEKQEVRSNAVRIAKLLYERKDLQALIEEFALKCLTHLLDPTPPEVLTGAAGPKVWNEDYSKICLQLYLALLPLNQKLIHNLATVYVGTVADIKRTILRVLEVPVKGMGMNSPEMLLLVENCPKGAETLVTRIIHILTDKAPPSADLVARVRDLYHKRVPDVRFLIPVLNGLTKKEVVAALPKLIKLNPIVVKEVFNRLLGCHADSGTPYTSPVTPAELLIALHNIDPSKCDMKTIIKATSMCFAEKQVYTQEVLAVVMQQLMEQNPLPTLLMRTVIQSLSLYPRLIGFVMNILQRLILKQVWRQKKVWEGFIKCCQRTKPQSFQVLLQLPPAQLKNVFETCADLRDPLLQHVNAFTEHQRAHLPQAIMDVLNGVEEKIAAEEKSAADSEVISKGVVGDGIPEGSAPSAGLVQKTVRSEALEPTATDPPTPERDASEEG